MKTNDAQVGNCENQKKKLTDFCQLLDNFFFFKQSQITIKFACGAHILSFSTPNSVSYISSSTYYSDFLVPITYFSNRNSNLLKLQNFHKTVMPFHFGKSVLTCKPYKAARCNVADSAPLLVRIEKYLIDQVARHRSRAVSKVLNIIVAKNR